MHIALYYAPYTCALAPWITLTEAGAEFEVRPLNFGRQQHMSADYMAINPKHKVPLLAVDGETMTESTAIQLWIARNFPDAGLLPDDPWQELEAVSLHSWCSSGIHPYLSRINAPPRVCDLPGAADNVVDHAKEYLAEAFGIADGMLEGREYFFERFATPDAHFFWCCRRATQFDFDFSAFPNTAAHFERMQGRDSVRKLLAYEKQVLDGFASAA